MNLPTKKTLLLSIPIASVWIFHGLFSKVLNGIPRHNLIVERILGSDLAPIATPFIGFLEISLGLWVLTGILKKLNATIQTLALISMNTLEIILAQDLLISAPGMVALNLCFIALIWTWALSSPNPSESKSTE
ncbi:MAG: DoxX-like family protein [Luteolibacter sp.]